MPNLSYQKKNYLTPPKILTYGLAIIIILGTFLLSLPISSKGTEPLSIVNSLFMATSATCVTGLSAVDTSIQFSLFGQTVMLLLVQIGGLGFMTMATLVAIAFNRKISFRERLILQQSMNQNSMEGIVSLIRRVLLYSFIIEAAGALLLGFRWAMEMPLGQALYFGVFHSISMFNNAGFDLFGQINGPFTGFNPYVDDFFVSTVVMCLIFLGGIGFIVMSDLIDFRRTRKLTLHSKVVLSASAGLIVFGALVVFIMERTNPLTMGPLSWDVQILSSFFHSISSRSGGASTLNMPDMEHSTQFLMIILMFIGSAPGSTGGGIKVTVFAILLGAMYAILRGRNDIVFFRHRLSKDSVFKAITQTWLALFLIIFVGMILSVLEDRDFLPLLFETTSAFATTGMSLGLTPKLTDISKVLLTCVMFLGRVGPLTLAYALAPKNSNKEQYRYPEGKITIG